MKKKTKFSLSRLKKLKTIFATIGVAIFVFLSFFCVGPVSQANVVMQKSPKEFEADLIKINKIHKDSIERYDIMIDSIKRELIDEVDVYIRKASNKSKMTGEYIVTRCLEYHFDIPLLMAQAHQETHFAHGGGRNNVFGIIYKRYSHPNDAVDDYIALMQRDYIINRTPEQLIKSGFRRENKGGKYAEDPSYSTRIKSLRDKILLNTNIDDLFNKYYILKQERDSLYEEYFEDSVQPDSTKVLC